MLHTRCIFVSFLQTVWSRFDSKGQEESERGSILRHQGHRDISLENLLLRRGLPGQPNRSEWIWHVERDGMIKIIYCSMYIYVSYNTVYTYIYISLFDCKLLLGMVSREHLPIFGSWFEQELPNMPPIPDHRDQLLNWTFVAHCPRNVWDCRSSNFGNGHCSMAGMGRFALWTLAKRFSVLLRHS